MPFDNAPTEPTLDSFIAFARGKPREEWYNFFNSSGGCAIGQWAHRLGLGLPWKGQTYATLSGILTPKGTSIGILVATDPYTWGALADRLEAARDA